MRSGCFSVLFHALLFNRLTLVSITPRVFRRGVIRRFCVLRELLKVYLINKILFIGGSCIILLFLTLWPTILLCMHASLLIHGATLLCRYFHSWPFFQNNHYLLPPLTLPL
jgi:hypothetical protein